MNHSGLRAAATFVATAVLGGCGQTNFPADLNTNLEQVEEIRDSDDLLPQQKRDELESLGLTPVQINGILRDERLANQFGGTLETAIQKVMSQTLSQLTPDEVQAYGDATGITEYSDSQAQAIADFFADNGISTAESLETLLDDATTEIPTEIDEDNLRAIFVDTVPDDLLDQLP
jgi:hypothetical protein